MGNSDTILREFLNSIERAKNVFYKSLELGKLTGLLYETSTTNENEEDYIKSVELHFGCVILVYDTDDLQNSFNINDFSIIF